MKKLDYVNKVFHADARTLLKALPTASIDSVLADPMYGVNNNPKQRATYDWGPDPAGGDPDKWWEYHGPIYHECLRVLKPGGTLAWAMGLKFTEHLTGWFGGHRIWPLSRFKTKGMACAARHIWVVQTAARTPIRYPDKSGLVVIDTTTVLRKVHPCPKPVSEMVWMVDALSESGQIVLDPFMGTGTTLVAAALLKRKFLGCDLSERYCRVAKKRLMDLNLVAS